MQRRYGLLGEKLSHSYSPELHALFGDYSYELFEIAPGDLGDFLRARNFYGLNVTIPYKTTVMAVCDQLSEAAEAIGSVNTIVRREGKLYGYNTDIDGFLYMLRRARISLMGKKVVVLGSGGASLTAQAAAKREGAREVVVVSRTGPDNYENLPQRHGDAEALVNTTPVGMWPRLEEAPVDLRLLPAVTDVVDVIYNPGRTNLLLQASGWNRNEFYYDDLGLWDERYFRCAGGLSMLAAQAKRAEELFFDRTIPDGDTEKIVAWLWQDRTNIVLVGMPGCGKTTVGRELARLSGKPFVDLDEEIVRRAGKSIPDIFREEGEAAFRELEAQVLADVCARSGQVIATGGGAVLRAENRAAMRRTGQVYFLCRNLEELPTDGRPLSQKGSLEEMYRVRKPLYSAAADTVIDNSVALEETAELIWRDFCENSGD